MTTVSSVLAVVAVSVPIVNRGVESRNSDLARSEIRKLVSELGSQPSMSQRGTREPASSDTLQKVLGLDPWGHPYQYKMLSNAYGQPTAMLVYSSGPNGQLESQLDFAKAAQSGDFAFAGDDIGVVKSLR